MEGILETLNEGVIILDDGDRILFVNSGFVEMTGMTQEDVTGRLVSDFYSAKEWRFVPEQVRIAPRFGRKSVRLLPFHSAKCKNERWPRSGLARRYR
jgi:PAS domain S-box-containing protein